MSLYSVSVISEFLKIHRKLTKFAYISMTTLKYVQFAYIMLCKDHSSYSLKDERVKKNRKEILEAAQTNKNTFAEHSEVNG